MDGPQQAAMSYLRCGCCWYVDGIVPERKEPTEIDHNVLEQLPNPATENARNPGLVTIGNIVWKLALSEYDVPSVPNADAFAAHSLSAD